MIVFNNEPDAVYDKLSDKLYFKKLEKITAIFKGVESLYREATDEEVTKFLANSFINIKNDYKSDNVNVLNRKRIASSMDVLDSLSKNDRDKILKYTAEYSSLKYENHDGIILEIGNNDDLAALLYGIQQRYYTTPVNSEKRIARAVQKLE